MSRTSILSHFLNLSSSSPLMSCRFQSRFLKRAELFSDYGKRGRCFCSLSHPQPQVSDNSTTSVRKRIVSGVQPTGSIHLGNYLGAIKNWVSLQDTYDTLFFIVDLHAITLPYDTRELSKATKDTAAIYLACGIDTSKASVFVQSHVRAHVELLWLLSSATPIGWLNRMIQFKEKSRKAVRLYWR